MVQAARNRLQSIVTRDHETGAYYLAVITLEALVTKEQAETLVKAIEAAYLEASKEVED